MAVPSGIKMGGNAVLLHKTLYGLKTAYSAERDAVRDALADLSLYPLEAEPCLLAQHCAYTPPIAMTYPGGVVVAGTEDLGYSVLDALLDAGLNAKRGPDDLIYGITVQRVDDRIMLSQPQYADRVVRRFRSVFTRLEAPAPTPELQKSLKALTGCLGWLARTTHLTFHHYAHLLARHAHHNLEGDEWENAWGNAWRALEHLKDPDTRALALILKPCRPDAPQLSASGRDNEGRHEIVVFYEDMAIEWFVRQARPKLDDEGYRYRAAQAAAEAVVRWNRTLSEIQHVHSVAVFAEVDFDNVRPAEMNLLFDTLRTTGVYDFDVKPFPEEDENGHKWCPCCCPVTDGYGE